MPWVLNLKMNHWATAHILIYFSLSIVFTQPWKLVRKTIPFHITVYNIIQYSPYVFSIIKVGDGYIGSLATLVTVISPIGIKSGSGSCCCRACDGGGCIGCVGSEVVAVVVQILADEHIDRPCIAVLRNEWVMFFDLMER